MTNYSLVMVFLAGCNLGPRVADAVDASVPADGPPAPDSGFTHLLLAGTAVPGIDTNPELLIQIRINDGLVDATLMASGGVVARSTGKSNGASVRYWNFGVAPIESGIAVLAPIYIFGTLDADVFTPLPDHPPLIDTIPGDIRYSPLRRVFNVPVTPLYNGELITTVAALGEALELGLVGDPVVDNTWVNMPVVLPGTTLEVGGVSPPASTKQVYGRGYRVDVFELGTSLGRQPLRTGFVPIAQASGLQTGIAVVSGTPPVPTLPVAVDAQVVFQYSIPTVPPGTTFSYSPLSTDVLVRLANGIAPATITGDLDLFRRSAAGAITSFRTDNVATFTIGTTVTNMQLQFTDGLP